MRVETVVKSKYIMRAMLLGHTENTLQSSSKQLINWKLIFFFNAESTGDLWELQSVGASPGPCKSYCTAGQDSLTVNLCYRCEESNIRF